MKIMVSPTRRLYHLPALWSRLPGVILVLIFHLSASGQCFLTRVYDTLLTGPGYGAYHITTPQWNPVDGLLMSVKITSIVNVQYSYTLRDQDVYTGNYSVVAGREDQISSPALITPYDSVKEQSLGTYTILPGNSINGAITLLTNYTNKDSLVYNLTPFVGMGTVPFTYTPDTYSTITSNNRAKYSFQASVIDATHFYVSYSYCQGWSVLASSLLSFTASLKNAGTVQLNWSAPNAVVGTRYGIERSRDGKSFGNIGWVDASADSGSGGLVNSYSYEDYIAGDTAGQGDNGRYYYRIIALAPAGYAYSPVREVTLTPGGGKGALILYPNPATDYVNIFMNAPGNGPWSAEILASDGSSVQRGAVFTANRFQLNFYRKLMPGVYFVRVTDIVSHLNYVSPFLVR